MGDSQPVRRVDTPASHLRNALAVIELLELERAGTIGRALLDVRSRIVFALELIERPDQDRKLGETWYDCPTWSLLGCCSCVPVFACQDAGRRAAAQSVRDQYAAMLATNRELAAIATAEG